MIFCIIMYSTFVYFFYNIIVEQLRCNSCKEDNSYCPTPHVLSWIISLVWPITIPIILLIKLIKKE